MKIIKAAVMILPFLSAMEGYGQQAPVFGMTSQLLHISNPAMFRSASPLNVTLAGRKYWTGIKNGPEAYVGSFSISPEDYKSALGGYIWKENAPLISKQTMGLSYAYGIKNMDENVNLRLGAGLDFISISSSNSSVLVDDYNDPFYSALFNNNRTSVDFRAGAVLNLSGLEIGAALQQIIKSKNALGETVKGNLDYNNRTVVNGHLKYNIKAGENFSISPLVFWQYQESVPLRMDINLLVEKTGLLWGGAYLRPKASYGVMGGLWILPEVKLGYMYEKTMFNSVSKAGNSHEILVSYSPSFKAFKKETPEPDKPEVVVPEPKHVVDTLVIVKEIRITEPAPSKPEEKPAPVVKETPSATSSFYVVTGLFSVKENADNLSRKLKALGYKPMLVKNKPKEQYYVAVGKFNSMNDAHEWIKKNAHPDYTFWVKEMKND